MVSFFFFFSLLPLFFVGCELNWLLIQRIEVNKTQLENYFAVETCWGGEGKKGLVMRLVEFTCIYFTGSVFFFLLIRCCLQFSPWIYKLPPISIYSVVFFASKSVFYVLIGTFLRV